MFPSSLIEFNSSLYQKPHQDPSYKAQPSLPVAFPEQTATQLDKGYQCIRSQNLDNLILDASGLHTMAAVSIPQSSSSQGLPTVSKVPSTSPSTSKNAEPASASLVESSEQYCVSENGDRLNIKEEPEEEKELDFQSVGLQDITLDDVSEIIVRDLFDAPESGNGNSVP